MKISDKLRIIKNGFENIPVRDSIKESALKYIQIWLSDTQFSDYVPQIEYLIESKKWDLLLDCFYQTIPFGTGGRRGEVGIGPNKINKWTIQASAQGHSQYLIKKFGEEAKTKGVVITYDVRIYTKKGIYNDSLPNPLKELSCKDLAEAAAEVYSANGIKIYFFHDVTSTPEMSFMVKHLGAVAGDMISASHNPPEFNGIKVVNEFGGQLLPPFDQELVEVVKNEIEKIKSIPFAEAVEKGIIIYIEPEQHQEYINAASEISIKNYRDAKILFSPFNGTTINSVIPLLKHLNFNFSVDPKTSSPDGRFPAIMFNIPNPEVEESYLGLIPEADRIGADIILVTDPDGDRIGLMSKEDSGWKFINGNEIFVLCTAYLLEEFASQNKLKPTNVIVKTLVTTELLTEMAKAYHVKIIGDLLVGIKYIAEEMNKLESEDKMDDFLIGGEESHGLTAGDYIREKDSCVPVILLSELASKLKQKNKTMDSYLNEIYSKYGYFHNFQNEIRLPGAEGMSQIAKIQEELRRLKPDTLGGYKIINMYDKWDGQPFSSDSDKISRNVLVYNLQSDNKQINLIKVTIRPSGTEPKTKVYYEIGMNSDLELGLSKQVAMKVASEVDKKVLTYLCSLIGINLPERAFLLFRMMATNDKLKYFEIESEIEGLKNISDSKLKMQKLNEILAFLGSNPIEKVDGAFKAKNEVGILEYLNLN